MKLQQSWIVMVLLSLYFCLFSFQKIDLITADIGRHIKNGEIFLHSQEFSVTKSALLHTNFFSYTNPTYPFINHHWGSGVLAYLIFSVFGFSGLSIAYSILLLSAILLIVLSIRHKSSPISVILSGLFLMPLALSRMEIRPEAVSYFFIAFFIFILFQYTKEHFSKKWLLILPLCQILWVNMHIYFIFGPFLLGVFLLEALAERKPNKVKVLFPILILDILATLLSPYGFSGAIYPFTIFQNYGYRIVENQSIPFLQKLGIADPNFIWYKTALFFLILSSVFVWFKKREKFTISLSIISLTFAVLGFLGIRSIALFGLVSIPLLALNLYTLEDKIKEKLDRDGKVIILCAVFILVIISVLVNFSSRMPWNRNFGLGLSKNSLDSIRFIKQTDIKGPVFNNYDIGGAMIFGLYPEEKVFVDNRPEAYGPGFFDNIYIPMQEKEEVWQKYLSEYKFNAIYFYRLDYTPWSQQFLLARVKDPQWAPVYVDAETIIFLNKNKENRDVINKYQLPAETFRVK